MIALLHSFNSKRFPDLHHSRANYYKFADKMVGVIDMTQDDDGCELIDLTLGDNDEELQPFNIIHRRDSSSPELISIVYKTQSSVVADQNVVNSTPSRMYKKEESADVPTYGRLLNTREGPKRRREDEARTNQSVMVTPVSSKKQRRGDGSSHNVTEPMPDSMWWPETPNRSGLSNATVTPCPTPSSPTKRQSVQENPCVLLNLCLLVVYPRRMLRVDDRWQM